MIKFKYEDKDYLLEFDRSTVEMLEKMGFSLQEYTNNIATMQPLLFRAAFFKNHRFEKNLNYDKMWDTVKQKGKLAGALLDMVAETYQTLMANDETSEGNDNWEVM